MNKKFIKILILVFLVQSLHSQELHNVEGRVYNIETGEPVSGASILVTKTLQGTSSGANGRFELRLPAGEYHIKVSSLGFSEKEFLLRVPSDNIEDTGIGLIGKKIEIEGVDVIGSLFIADRDTSINRVPVSILPAVTRISAIEIERQGAVTLTDAFKYVPGGWTETRGRKVKQFFSVRGQRYPYPDYSINGIWQKEFEETSYFFSALDVESVEIVRSSSALVKGLSGLTGVVDVRTKRPVGETISFSAKYGQQNNYVTNFRYGNKINDVTFNTSATLFGTDGPPGRNGKERIGNFHGDIDWEINSKLKLSAGTAYIGGSREFVSIIEAESSAPNLLGREEAFDPLRTSLNYAKLYYRGDDNSLTELQTSFSYRDAYYRRYDLPGQETGQEKDWEYGFNLLHSRPLSSTNTLRLGVLYNHWEAPEGKRYYAGRACNVHTWSGVIASEQRAGKFLFDAGIRLISGYIVEFGDFGIEGGMPAVLLNAASIEDEIAPLEWQSVLGVSYIHSGALSFHYNFSGGTIAPRRGSLTDQGVTPENETRFQHDLGFRHITNNRNEITFSTFYAQRQDALELSGETVITGDDYLMELYENLDKRSYGVELSIKFNIPVIHSFLFANATLMRGENEIEGRMEKDDKLPNVILNTGVLFEHSGFDANLFVNYTGPYTNNRFVRGPWIAEHGDFPLGDFFSFDITAGYTFDRRFSTRVFAEVKNLLDQRYLTVAGYPDYGRLLFSGVRINF